MTGNQRQEETPERIEIEIPRSNLQKQYWSWVNLWKDEYYEKRLETRGRNLLYEWKDVTCLVLNFEEISFMNEDKIGGDSSQREVKLSGF